MSFEMFCLKAIFPSVILSTSWGIIEDVPIVSIFKISSMIFNEIRATLKLESARSLIKVGKKVLASTYCSVLSLVLVNFI